MFLLSLTAIWSSSCLSSPWIEGNDPLLRSHLHVLIDQGVLNSSVGTFPLRWSLIASQLASTDIDDLTPETALSYRYVKHAYDVDRVGRASKGGGAFWKTERHSFRGFSDSAYGKEWNTMVLTESSNKTFAYRLTTNYGQAWTDSSPKFDLSGSYVVFGSGLWQLALDKQDRWWGYGWVNSLSWSHKGEALDTLNLGRTIEIYPHLELWLETNVSSLGKYHPSDYLWSARGSTRLLELDIGASVQYVQGGSDTYNSNAENVMLDGDVRYTADFRVSMPSMSNFSSSLYNSLSKSRYSTRVDGLTILLGLDAHTIVKGISIRGYIERLTWEKGVANMDVISPVAPEADNLSTGLIFSFPNDHTLQLGYRHFEQSIAAPELSNTNLSYNFLAFSGMTSVSADLEKENQETNYSFNLGWEFRF